MRQSFAHCSAGLEAKLSLLLEQALLLVLLQA